MLSLIAPAISLIGLAPAPMGNCMGGFVGEACAGTSPSGINYHYSAREKTFFQVPAGYKPASTATLTFTSVVACGANRPGATGDDLCQAARCSVSGAPGVKFRVFARPIQPPKPTDDDPDPSWEWEPVGTTCVAGRNRVTVDDLDDAWRDILEEHFRALSAPVVHVQPAGTTLVNLPTIAWTNQPKSVSITIKNPLPGTIRATGTFAWQWSNGARDTGLGQPYNGRRPPRQFPGDYVTTTYTSPGSASVRVTGTWKATFTMPGVATVNLDPVTFTTTQGFNVTQARTELISAE